MYKIFIIVGVIPLIINIILYVIPLKEKGKFGKVTVPKSAFLITPIIADLVLGCGLIANVISYVNSNFSDKEEFKTIILFSVVLVLSVIPLICYKKSIVKYDADKIFYHKKWYNFSDIQSFGNDQKSYVFVTKTGEKIKIDILAVGFDLLYKTYQDYKNKKI